MSKSISKSKHRKGAKSSHATDEKNIKFIELKPHPADMPTSVVEEKNNVSRLNGKDGLTKVPVSEERDVNLTEPKSYSAEIPASADGKENDISKLNDKDGLINAPIVEEKDIKLTNPESYAAGMPALVAGAEFLKEETGFVRGVKALLAMNQKDGFDCPSCAWPDPDDRSRFEFCENGIKAITEEATLKVVKEDFFTKNSIQSLSKQSDYAIGKSGRINEPMLLEEGEKHYKSISWQGAYDLIAEEFKKLQNPDEAVFYTSGRTSNEAAYLYQLFAKAVGTNNLPDCSNMCHESSGFALKESIGIGKGTVKLEDFAKSDLILIIGQNPGTNHPRMLSALREAVDNGAKVISINPLNEAGIKAFRHPQKPLDYVRKAPKIASEFYQIKVGGDYALFAGINKLILEKFPNGIDKEFVKNQTERLDELKTTLDGISWEYIEESTGFEKERIELLANSIMEAKNMISCWAMGLTQRKDSVYAIRSIVNTHLLCGFIGKEGSGLCPVRGHSNVQGDRTVGIFEKPPKPFLDSLENYYRFKMPREEGYDVVESIKAMNEGKVKIFMALGGNFLSATPDTDYTTKGLQKLNLSVQISTKLNRSHLITGKKALILPCYGRSEKDASSSKNKFVTVENSMGFVSKSEGKLNSRSTNPKSEVAIVCDIASKVLEKSDVKIDWKALKGDFNLIRNHIEAVIPGFKNYNERINSDKGFYLPNSPRDSRSFDTPSGKAMFSSYGVVENGDVASRGKIKNDEYILFTIRSHDQFNTTVYGLSDRYRGIYNARRVLLMNKEDMDREGFKELQEVDVKSFYEEHTCEAERFKVIPYNLPKGCIGAYFPEANVLIPIYSTADKSNTPSFKYVRVKLFERAA